jgi:hypothetical protein
MHILGSQNLFSATYIHADFGFLRAGSSESMVWQIFWSVGNTVTCHMVTSAQFGCKFRLNSTVSFLQNQSSHPQPTA